MKKFESFNIIDEDEKRFLKLSHLDKLNIVFDFIDNDEFIFYLYNEYVLFEQNKPSKIFYINTYEIWSPISYKNNLDYNGMTNLMEHMIEKYFKLTGYNICDDYCDSLEFF